MLLNAVGLFVKELLTILRFLAIYPYKTRRFLPVTLEVRSSMPITQR